MAVTMRDVAHRAGVSIKTVSRVVNNQGEISEATRQRVLAAIEEIGFQPNTLARGLVSGTTLSVGLIVSEITDPFYPELVLGAENVARGRSYHVFLCNTNGQPEQELEYINALAAKQVDGMILCGSRLTTEQLEPVVAKHKLVVLTGWKPRDSATVDIDGECGVYQITAHLIRLGHRAIAHVGCSPERGTSRKAGYERALSENNLPLKAHWCIAMPQVSIEEGRQATKQLLQQAPEITAITCFNDLVAIGALRACVDLGIRVPQDIAVVGFDDIPLASLVTPALTTMIVPRYRLGQMLMELLLRVIAAPGPYEEHLVVEPELVIRESCGAQARTPVSLEATAAKNHQLV